MSPCPRHPRAERDSRRRCRGCTRAAVAKSRARSAADDADSYAPPVTAVAALLEIEVPRSYAEPVSIPASAFPTEKLYELLGGEW